MKYQYSVQQKTNAYDGFFKFYRYHVSFEKFRGGFIKNVMRECSKKGDIVAVLPYDPIRQEFLMIEQFRIGMLARDEHPWTLEIVAGFMDIPGETPVQTAQRELKEETSCQALNIFPLIEYYPSPGGSAAKNHLFIATVDTSKAKKFTGIIEEGEDICVHKIALDEIQQKLKAAEINNSTAIIAFQQFFMNGWAAKLSNK